MWDQDTQIYLAIYHKNLLFSTYIMIYVNDTTLPMLQLFHLNF